jgi:hypothetical protein
MIQGKEKKKKDKYCNNMKKSASHISIITLKGLVLFLELLQMVLEPPSNARSCGIGALHDVTLTRTSGV